MTTLSNQEKRELLADAASAARRADFTRMASQPAALFPLEHIEFLTWASGLSKEDANARGRPVEKVMLL